MVTQKETLAILESTDAGDKFASTTVEDPFVYDQLGGTWSTTIILLSCSKDVTRKVDGSFTSSKETVIG